MAKKVASSASIAFVVLLISSCPNQPDPTEDPDTSILLELVDYWTTSATLEISVSDTTQIWGFALSRNDSLVVLGQGSGAAIIIVDENLFPDTEYSYMVYFMDNSEIVDSSSTLHVYTRPTEELFGLPEVKVSQMKIYQNYLYVATWHQGLWRREILTDSSVWENLGLSITDLGYDEYYIQDFIQKENNSNEMLVAGITNNYEVPGTFKSQDGGENWFPSSNGLEYPSSSGGQEYFNFPKLFQIAGDRLLAVGDAGPGVLFIESSDFGLSWETDTTFAGFGQPFTDIRVFENHKFVDTQLWVTGTTIWQGYPLLRSINSGMNWSHVELDIAQSVYISAIVPHPAESDILYTALFDPGVILKVYNADVQGQEIVLPTESLFTYPYSTSYTPGFSSITMDMNNWDHLICAGGHYVFETFDAGETWSELSTKISTDHFIRVLCYDSKSEQLFIGTDLGVYVCR